MFNTLSTLTLLEAIKTTCPHARLFHASSSEMFDPRSDEPHTIGSRLAPANPYGVAKASAHLMVQSYRTTCDLFAVNGILFPHESPLRQPQAFTTSLVRQALAIKHGTLDHITLGQSANKRDFGNARDFTRAMWLSLQNDRATDYIIGTGVATHIHALAEYVCSQVGIPTTVLIHDHRRESEPVTTVVADPTATTAALGWSASGTIYTTLDEIIQYQTSRPVDAHD